MATKRLCAVEGCDKPNHAHGFCGRHAYKFKAHGDPLGGRRGASPGAPMEWIKQNKDYSEDGCLVWPFEITRIGYGTVKHQGKRRPASRVMCIVVYGPPPSAAFDAAHSCGNRNCCNPRHLSWKTRQGNMADAIEQGTWKRGNMDPHAKLTEGDVRDIRKLASKFKQRELAEMFGVNQQQISKVINREQWAWVK